MTSPTAPRHARLAVWPHVVWAGLVVTVVVAVLLAAASTTQPDGQCTGIGWGCTVSGGDLAALLAVFLVPPAVIVLLVGHLTIWAVQRWRRR